MGPVLRGEKQMTSKGDPAFGKFDRVGFGVVASGKPPCLIEFVGVWEIGLGHQANHHSVRPDQACCVEQAAGDRDR